MNFLKAKQILLTIFSILLLGAYTSSLQAQETESKKKVVIITKKIDADGNEVVDKKVLEGEDAEAFEIEEMKEGDFKDVDVNIEKSDDGKTKRVIKIRTDKGGEVEEYEFEGNNEDIKVLEKDDGVFILKKESDEEEEMEITVTEKDGHMVIIKKDGNGNIEKIDVTDEGDNIFISSDEDFGENVEIEKTIIEEDGVKKEIIVKRQYANNKAFLGIMLKKGDEAGVLIDKVVKDSPAEKAGLKSGDLITHINKSPVTSLDKLTKALSPFKADDTIAITYKRGSKATTTNARLAEHKIQSGEKNIWKTDEGEEIDLKGKEHKMIKKKKGE